MTTQHETELLAANAALELEVVRLRNALETFIAEHEECEDSDGWMAQMCMEDHDFYSQCALRISRESEMKTITYNPETHVLVPREPTRDMVIAGTHQRFRDSYDAEEDCYRAMLAAAPQPEPNPNWCAGCSPDNCSGCGAEPVESEPAMWVMKHIRSGDLAQAKPNQKALHPRMWSQAHLYTTPQPDRVAELEAALKVARDGIDKFLVANDPTEFGCACDLSVGYLCGPCHADKQQEPLKIALAKINEVLK